MTDRQPTHPGRVRLVPVSGQTNIYDMTLADQPTVSGTPLNKATLLSDAAAALLHLSGDPTVNNALMQLYYQMTGHHVSIAADVTSVTLAPEHAGRRLNILANSGTVTVWLPNDDAIAVDDVFTIHVNSPNTVVILRAASGVELRTAGGLTEEGGLTYIALPRGDAVLRKSGSTIWFVSSGDSTTEFSRVVDVSSNLSLSAAYSGAYLKCATGSAAITLTIPTNADRPIPIGTEIKIMRFGANDVTFSPASGVTLCAKASARRISANYGVATLKKLMANQWALWGDLA